MIKTVIFDFDGTVADTMPLIIELFNRIAEENGLPKITKKNIDVLKNSSAKELIFKYKISALRLLKFQREFQEKISKRIDEISVFEGMSSVIKRLRDKEIKVGIVTSNSKDNVVKFLRKHNISVDFVNGERDIFGKGKKLIKLIKRLSLLREETMYVGDEVRDIEAAREAGIKIAAVTWGMNSEDRLKKAEPDFLVKKPLEIMALI